MNKMTAKNYMNKCDKLCHQDSYIKDLAEQGAFSDQYSYVLDNQGILVGRVDFNRLLELSGPNLLFSTQKNKGFLSERLGNLKISEIMDECLRVIDADCSLGEIMEIILADNNKLLPVVDENGFFIGELSAGSILENVINFDDSVGVFGRDVVSGAAV